MVQGISFDGLASGMATDEIVRGLMEVERSPIRRLERQKEAQQAIRDTWREVNMQLNSLDQSLTQLRLSATFESFTSTSSTDTVATASATSEADPGNFHLNIQTIATAHRVASDAQFSSTAALEEEGDIQINGVKISIGAGDSLEAIRDKINSAYGVGVSARIISNTLVLESQRTGIENEIQVVDDNDVLVNLGILSGELDNLVGEVPGVDVAVSSNEGDADNVINGDPGVGWTSDDPAPQWVDLIFKDEHDERWPIRLNRLELYTPDEGEAGSIIDFDVYAWDYVHGEGHLVASVRDNTEENIVIDFNTIETEHLRINILASEGDVAKVQELEVYNRSQQFKNTLVEADDARLTINGVAVQSDRNNIDDVVKGMTFSLITVGETTITVAQDLEQPIEAVRAFVEQYNSTMGFIADKLDYDHDTKEAGILQGDSTLMRLHHGIRRDLMGGVALGEAHNYGQLMDIGIEVDRYGLMSLDEGKLQQALQQNPDDVQLLFTAEGYGSTEEWEGATGAAVRLHDRLQSYMRSGGIIYNRDQMYFNMMRRIDLRIDALERRMEMKELSLRRQFVRLESVMSDFMSQSEWLEGQLKQLVGFSRDD